MSGVYHSIISIQLTATAIDLLWKIIDLNQNSNGPRIDPCGTPVLTGCTMSAKGLGTLV